LTTESDTIIYDPRRPVCRRGIKARPLTAGMVYIRHQDFSSQIINQQSWGFLQLCDGISIEELNEQLPDRLGFQLSLDQLRSSVEGFAARGLFEGTREVSRHYRLFDASWLTARLAPLVRWAESRWFACLTLLALIACVVLLVTDWSRFTNAVAHAARERPVATLLLYYLTFIPVALAHELGHAIVIRYHGGEVPEVVLRRNAHFAVLSNTRVLKERASMIWYLSMGTVVDVYIWLALLVAFHYYDNYLLLMFLLPQTVYCMLYSYSIFNNSDYLKVVAVWLGQPVPSRPWVFLRDAWRKRPESAAEHKLLYVMTASLVVKITVTTFLIWTFAVREYLVLALYAIYKLLVYLVGHWPKWARRLQPKQG
jgi:hypothetical protein